MITAEQAKVNVLSIERTAEEKIKVKANNLCENLIHAVITSDSQQGKSHTTLDLVGYGDLVIHQVQCLLAEQGYTTERRGFILQISWGE